MFQIIYNLLFRAGSWEVADVVSIRRNLNICFPYPYSLIINLELHHSCEGKKKVFVPEIQGDVSLKGLS